MRTEAVSDDAYKVSVYFTTHHPSRPTGYFLVGLEFRDWPVIPAPDWAKEGA